jgi:hypothetical protein
MKDSSTLRHLHQFLTEESLFGPNIEQKILSQEHNERFFYLVK